MLSLIIPVYNNESSLPGLVSELEQVADALQDTLEVVFVVDGSMDGSLDWLKAKLPAWRVRAQLVELSRNFGSFPAIAAGMQRAHGDYVAVIAADRQEPPDLVLEFHKRLRAGEADVAFGHRVGRADPWLSRATAHVFWGLYRRFVLPAMPSGGVDVFACTRQVRDQVVQLREVNTNLVALVLWVGFRRTFVPYERRSRLEGRSGWTFGRKARYALDSIFGFTDLPIRTLLLMGAAGTTLAVIAAVTVLLMWSLGRITVLGYTPLILAITFFGALTALGLGIVGQYLWLSLQNVRGRPSFVVRSVTEYAGQAPTVARNSS